MISHPLLSVWHLGVIITCQKYSGNISSVLCWCAQFALYQRSISSSFILHVPVGCCKMNEIAGNKLNWIIYWQLKSISPCLVFYRSPFFSFAQIQCWNQESWFSWPLRAGNDKTHFSKKQWVVPSSPWWTISITQLLTRQNNDFRLSQQIIQGHSSFTVYTQRLTKGDTLPNTIPDTVWLISWLIG